MKRRSRRKARRPLPFWRRRLIRMIFHAYVLGIFAINLAVLDSDDRVWLLCAIPVVGMSSLQLWRSRKRRKLTPAELLKELRGPELPRDDGYRNATQSSVTEAAGWHV